MVSEQGIFSISLDLELHWGVFDNVAINNRLDYFDNTIQVIPKINSLFKANRIEATWATVGLLFNKNIEAIKHNYPSKLPSYQNSKLSAYSFIENEMKEGYDRFYTALDLIKLIDSTEGQEIGTHTYSHYYTKEKGQTKEEFESDMVKFVSIARQNNIEVQSIVFPRNQIAPDYIEVCKKYGVVNIRTNPTQWFFNLNKKNKLAKKIARSLDCYLPLYRLDVNLNVLNKNNKDIYYHQFSRFLKPITGVSILDKLRIRRIKSEMTKAAKKGTYYHLWWHPHNFGHYPTESMKELEEIISHFKKLKSTYGMKSLNMKNTHKLAINEK